jgi:hypothetical protein
MAERPDATIVTDPCRTRPGLEMDDIVFLGSLR